MELEIMYDHHLIVLVILMCLYGVILTICAMAGKTSAKNLYISWIIIIISIAYIGHIV